jgi:hypothetical protein
MKYKNLKDSVLKLIDLKFETSEIIQRIYAESGDIRLCLYDTNEIFVENPYGLETLAKLFKKRIITCPQKNKGKYPIKKYFEYKGIEFFCLYKEKKERNPKFQKVAETLGKVIPIFKKIGLFVWTIVKFAVK